LGREEQIRYHVKTNEVNWMKWKEYGEGTNKIGKRKDMKSCGN